jgi:hypothetical protein
MSIFISLIRAKDSTKGSNAVAMSPLILRRFVGALSRLSGRLMFVERERGRGRVGRSRLPMEIRHLPCCLLIVRLDHPAVGSSTWPGGQPFHPRLS